MKQANFTRRSFLAAGAAVAARGLLAPPAAVGANDRIRLGVIGCGGICMADLGCFLQNREVEVPVVCDVDDARIRNGVDLVEAQRGKAPEAVKDFRRVIERKDVDALLVCTPDHWHALPTVYGCQAGKDVYVEKPLARTIDEGRAMREAARQNKRVVQMGTQRRSMAMYADAAEFVRSGQLGKVRTVRAWAYLDWVGGIGSPPDGPAPAGVDYDLWLGPAPLRPFNPNRFHFNFRWHWDYAGGLMTDWGVHLLDICLWAMGDQPLLRVTSAGGKRVVDDNTETPDTQFTLYDFPDYNLIWEHQVAGGIGPNGRSWGMYFSGTEGALLIDDTGWEIIPEPKREKLKALPQSPAGPGETGPVFPHLGGAKRPASPDGRPAHVRNFLDCILSRKDPAMDIDTAHYVSTVAHLGNLALRSQSEIHWDMETEVVKDNPAADALVGGTYRAPWTLPYARRA